MPGPLQHADRTAMTARFSQSREMATLICVAALSPAAVGIPPSLPSAVPNDVPAVGFVDPQDHAGPRGPLDSLNIARFVVDQAGELGLLSRVDPVSRAWIDTLAALSVLLERSEEHTSELQSQSNL